MPHIKLHHPFRSLALLTGLSIFFVGHQISFAQDSPDYIQFLEQNSIRFQADQEAAKISGQGIQWQHSYGTPETSQLVNAASVWFLYYPASVITPPNQSVIGTWALPQFWDNM